ncbi:hypothetical protein PC119_g22311 [Phytophthora cactorum]|nr:hypothetical protein PC119_g22311 [Phytophthora cactorum]
MRPSNRSFAKGIQLMAGSDVNSDSLIGGFSISIDRCWRPVRVRVKTFNVSTLDVVSDVCPTRPKPLLVSVKTFEGKDEENLLLWTRKVEMAMGSALLQNKQERLKQQLSHKFAPSNQAYRIRSRFLATRQGKKELLDYVQELRTLIAGTAADPLPEAVTLTVFMEGIRTSAARTEVFRVHPSSFEEAVSVALNAEHDFRSARPGWYAGSAGSLSGPEPMDLRYAENEEAELLAAEQRTSIRRCFTCGSTRHLRASCPVRNQRKAPPSQASGSSRGNGDSQ